MGNAVPTQHSSMPFALRHTRRAGGKERQDEKAQAQAEQKQGTPVYTWPMETGARCTQSQDKRMLWILVKDFPVFALLRSQPKTNKRNLFHHQGHLKMLNSDKAEHFSL